LTEQPARGEQPPADGPDARRRVADLLGSLLPEATSDDTDLGWGERRGGEDRDDLDRFLRERPPHHDAD
jgi:hypothetical protein